MTKYTLKLRLINLGDYIDRGESGNFECYNKKVMWDLLNVYLVSVQKEIFHLKEYRQSLISNAVTGKIKVI